MSGFDFLGKGIKFPFRINAVGGTGTSVATSETFDHINESIRQILGTRIGERVRLLEFGSRLKELVFEPNDDVLKNLAKVYVADAIRSWEKRVILKEIDINSDPDGHLFNIGIFYTVIKNQKTGNLVYPFYVQV